MRFDEAAIFFRVDTKDVHYVNCIFEGCEYLGVVSTVDRAKGILVVRATPGTVADAREILAHLPVPVEFIDGAEIADIIKP
jgi:hypothetical protein